MMLQALPLLFWVRAALLFCRAKAGRRCFVSLSFGRNKRRNIQAKRRNIKYQYFTISYSMEIP